MPASLTLCRTLFLAAAVSLTFAACDSSESEPTTGVSPDFISQYPEPKVLADFRLQNRDGKTVDKSILEDHWQLLFFGFTHCPDICPTTLQQLSLTQAAWSGDGTAPEVVLVSVDPDRDSAPRMDAYLSAFKGEFQGLTGDYRQIRALAAQLGARITAPESAGADPDHSGAVYLINPDGDLQAVIAPDFVPDALARRLAEMTEEPGDA